MNRRIFLAASLLLAAVSTPFAFADDVVSGNLAISGAFSRASPMMAQAGAGFMTIANKGDADRLIAAKSDVSELVELHTHIDENGMMAMRKVDAIDVPANGAVELKPGSFHIMFINLRQPLKEGSEIDAVLVFEKAGEVAVKLPVKGPGAMN